MTCDHSAPAYKAIESSVLYQSYIKYRERHPRDTLTVSVPFDTTLALPELRLLIDSPLSAASCKMVGYLIDLGWFDVTEVIDVSRQDSACEVYGARFPNLYFHGYIIGSVEMFLKMYESFRFKGTGLKRLVEYYNAWVMSGYDHEKGCKYNFVKRWPKELSSCNDLTYESDGYRSHKPFSEGSDQSNEDKVNRPKFITADGSTVEFDQLVCLVNKKFQPENSSFLHTGPLSLKSRYPDNSLLGETIEEWLETDTAVGPLLHGQGAIAIQCLLDFLAILPVEKTDRLHTERKKYLGVSRTKLIKEDYNLVYNPKIAYQSSYHNYDGVLNNMMVGPRSNTEGFVNAIQTSRNIYHCLSVRWGGIMKGDGSTVAAWEPSLVTSLCGLQSVNAYNLCQEQYCSVHHPSPFSSPRPLMAQYERALAKKDPQSIYKAMTSCSQSVKISGGGQAMFAHKTSKLSETTEHESQYSQTGDTSILSGGINYSRHCPCTAITNDPNSLYEDIIIWINLHNMCYYQGIMDYGVPTTNAAHKSFNSFIGYYIGGHKITLYEMKRIIFKLYNSQVTLGTEPSNWNRRGSLRLRSGSDGIADDRSISPSFSSSSAGGNTSARHRSAGLASAVTQSERLKGGLNSSPRPLSSPYSGLFSTLKSTYRRLGSGNAGGVPGDFIGFSKPLSADDATRIVGRYQKLSKTTGAKRMNVDPAIWLSLFDVSNVTEMDQLMLPLLEPTNSEGVFLANAMDMCNTDEHIRVEMTHEFLATISALHDRHIDINVVDAEDASWVVGGTDQNKKHQGIQARVLLSNSMSYMTCFSKRRNKDVLSLLGRHCTGDKKIALDHIVKQLGRNKTTIQVDFATFSVPEGLVDLLGAFNSPDSSKLNR